MQHLLDVQMGTPEWIFIVIALGLISFFSVRFYMTVDEVRKDVKSLLIDSAIRKEKIEQIESDVESIKERLHKHGNVLQNHEMSLNILKNKSS